MAKSMQPSIKISFEGIIVLVFSENDAECLAGVLKDVHGHKFTIEAWKIDGAGHQTPVPIPPNCSDVFLEVKGTSTSGIGFAGGAVDRLCTADSESYGWVFDFDSSECHDKPSGIKPGTFQPIVRTNKGELYTIAVSQNHLLSRPEQASDAPYKVTGRVATIVGIRTQLDPGNVAQLIVDGQTPPLIDIKPGEQFLMDVKNIPVSPGFHGGHANNYYKALGSKLRPEDKRFFTSSEFRATPEASCLVGSARLSGPSIM